MSLEQKVELLTTAVLALTSAIQAAAGKPLAPIIGADANVKINGAAHPALATTAPPVPTTPPPAAADKVVLNKDGETPTYAKEVKPVLLALVKTHGKEFALAKLQALGYDHTGLTPIKGGEKKPGEYAAALAALNAGALEPSPIAAIA